VTRIEPEATLRAGVHFHRVRDLAALWWGACVQSGDTALADKGRETLEALRQLARPLQDAGAFAHNTHGSPDAADSLSLSDLSALESVRPDLESLRTLLGQALTVAERIDEARGRSYPEPVGGSCGWDFAEEVNQLLARVELDSGGARGKGLE
jgi:hypothetical protein